MEYTPFNRGRRDTRPTPSVSTIRELMEYDPQTGEFRWIKNRQKAKIGTVAGANCNGYILIWVSGEAFYAHRLAWKLMTGRDPSKHIDHVNRIRSDNRFENLREATSSENQRNKGSSRKTRYKIGVSKGYGGGFYASITVEGKTLKSPKVTSIERAVEYREFAEDLFFGCFAPRKTEATSHQAYINVKKG